MKFSGQDLQGQESKARSTSIEPTLSTQHEPALRIMMTRLNSFAFRHAGWHAKARGISTERPAQAAVCRSMTWRKASSASLRSPSFADRSQPAKSGAARRTTSSSGETAHPPYFRLPCPSRSASTSGMSDKSISASDICRSRVQSVAESFEEFFPFMGCGLAHRDDSSDVASISVRNDDDKIFQKPYAEITDLGEARILCRQYWPLQNARRISKIQTVLSQVGEPLVFVPFILHCSSTRDATPSMKHDLSRVTPRVNSSLELALYISSMYPTCSTDLHQVDRVKAIALAFAFGLRSHHSPGHLAPASLRSPGAASEKDLWS